MAKASAAMAAIGRANNPVVLAATMQNFANENAKMDVRQEMIDESLDGALDDGDAEQETDDVMNQVWGTHNSQGVTQCYLLVCACSATLPMFSRHS